MKPDTLVRAAAMSILIVAVVITLIYGQNLMIPLVFAILIWFLVREITKALDRIPFIRKRFPRWLKNLITSLIILSFLGFVGRILTSSIQNLADSYQVYEANVTSIVDKINNTFNIDIGAYISENAMDFDFGAILGSIFNSLSYILGNTFLILIYALFVFLEEAVFQNKLKGIFSNRSGYETTVEMLEKIESSITRYIGLKTLISLITGILSYVVLLIIGVDSPVFWAFLIFLLNYIPTIGSLIATTFPAIFALLQYGEFYYLFMVLIFVGVVQLAVGNVLEPKMMGNSLNISPLVAILSLTFWGAVWGVTGMFLGVPITVILVIIFSHFDSTRPVAIMLSEKGKVNQ